MQREIRAGILWSVHRWTTSKLDNHLDKILKKERTAHLIRLFLLRQVEPGTSQYAFALSCLTCSQLILMVICWKSLKFYCHFRPFTLYFCRYSILAPNAIPQGFVDGKVVTEKVLAALQLDLNDYRLGHTKVFFRAGVLGALEDMRDERLSKIVSLFQAHIRGYTMRRSYNKLQDQRYAWL